MTILDVVPAERRVLVTNHDALGYFADRYGFEVLGTVIPGGATLADPSSADLAELVATIQREEVPAIFAETIEPSVLAETVAAEVGDQVRVVELFTGSLGEEGSGAETLIDALIINARRIAEALG
jgi:zinc/manganese transport system substrate-binding protein